MSQTRVRTRIKRAPVYPLLYQYYDTAPVNSYVVFVDRETTADEEHPWGWFKEAIHNPASAGFLSHVDLGGNFTSVKTSAELLSSNPVVLKAFPYKGAYLYNFQGPLIPSRPAASSLRADVQIMEPLVPGSSVSSIDQKNTNPELWPSVVDTDEELAVLGASILSKLSPVAPHNSVYTSLGELRNDGLPSIPFLSFLKKNEWRFLREAKADDRSWSQKLGGEWLNYQFGIAPTVSDVKSILDTIHNADKLWKQYLRDSGRLVRRRMDMDPETTVETGVLYNRADIIPIQTRSNHWSSVGPVEHVTTTTRKRWFSAAYMYYVDSSSLDRMNGWAERSNYLYGWKPTPSAVYNLTAWTWLLDWFTNVGDVIDNISMYLSDPFLVRWAYIMEESSIERVITQRLVDNNGVVRVASMRLTTHVKKRRKVNPLHFGVDYDALSARQLSILAALGMTRGRDPGLM